MDLLEREAPRAAVAAALAGARQGRGSTVFLVGEPGLGKTTLLAQCATGAAGFTVAKAACSELEQSVPFGLLDRLLAGFAGAVVQATGASPGAAGAGSAEARLHRYSTILDWLRHRAPAPLLLVVDDLHWADADSVELLDLLCRRTEGLPVAVVAAARPWPAGAVDHARSLVADGYAVLERLQPLSERACATLLEDRLGGDLPTGFVERASSACAGNPVLLGEVADARLRGEDLLGGPTSRLGERVFLPRFAGVGAAALRWARTASVLGTRFWPALVQRISDQPLDDTLVAMEALDRAGLLRVLGNGQAEFVHPLFRQALYDDLFPGLRLGLHARAFRALLAEGAGVTEAAPHAVAAQLKGDADAVAVVAEAGRQALAAGAAATAAGHLQAALALSGPSPAPSLYFELAEAALVAGNVPLAEQALDELLARQDIHPSEQVAGARAQARVLLAAGRYPEAKRRFDEASALAEPSNPDLAAEILLDGAFIAHYFEGPRHALRTVRRAVGIVDGSPSAGEGLRLAAAIAEGNLACVTGDPASLDDIAAAAKARLVLDRSRASWAWDIVFAYALLAKVFERFEDCELVFASLMEAARHQGAAVTYQTLAINHADVLWRRGQLDRARELVAEAAAVAELVPSLAPFAWVGLAHTHYEQADWAASSTWASRVEQALEGIGGAPYLRLWLCLLECREKLRRGDVGGAVEAAERAERTAEASGITEPCVVPWHGAAIEALVTAGRLDRAAGLVASLERVCEPLPCHAPRAVAASGTALVAWRAGDRPAAEAAFERALAHNRAVAMPLAAAETLVLYGRFLRHGGALVRARDVLHQALAALDGTGARRLQAMANDELALAGGRRARTRPTGELTAMELRAAELAGQGLTNPEIAQQLFLSVKTVEHHLSRAYAKLGLASRRDLIRATRAREDLPGRHPEA